MMRLDSSSLIGAYAALLTLGIAGYVLHRASSEEKKEFTEIDVQRINIREPDGTLRMSISGHAKMPGIIVGKKEYPHPGRLGGGLLFYNDEGIENGGLIYGGGVVNGKPTNGGSLTFDRYKQDQTVQVVSDEEGSERYAGLYVNDQPDQAMEYGNLASVATMSEGPERQRLIAQGHFGQVSRLFIGRDVDAASKVVLRDALGRKRLILSVTGEGTPSITFLDAAGKTVRTIGTSDLR